ncbi:hypothetical protein L6164_004264 [Bauhinia variegata]|uniref:Uncharacterized protein n=1 Tax=Bauhinia variegata TaxID=167791 RepID=A0ACB9Q3W4_BAUVA|nr:hypothetical protein L6164_004264 [Bauhinia variegata]
MVSYHDAGILIVGALVIALIFFGLTMLGCCTCIRTSSLPTAQVDDKISGCKSYLESHSLTFLYKKAAGGSVEGTDQTECSICLTAFEEDDCVRQLSSCKHMFHKVCIDQWLSFHSGCPICRTKIDKVDPPPNGTVISEGSGQMTSVIVGS